MNAINTGMIIRKLRTELKLTQKELAEKLYISDKAVSKWERGVGLPDISLIKELSDVFNVSVEYLLGGEKEEKSKMKKQSFYVCDDCGNIIMSTDKTDIVCCDRRLDRLEPQKADEEHMLDIEVNDGSYLITSSHEMTKKHYISFVAIRQAMSTQLIETFPEWEMNVRHENLRFSRVYYYCTNHGLFYQQVK